MDSITQAMNSQLTAAIMSVVGNLVLPVVRIMAGVLMIFFIGKFVYEMSQNRQPEVMPLVIQVVLCLLVIAGAPIIWNAIKVGAGIA